MLSDACIRASWECQREILRSFLLNEKKFNPKSVDRAIDNFIESAVFAKMPSGTKEGIAGAWLKFKTEQ